MTDNQYEAKEWLNRMFKMAQDIEATKRTLETILAEMGGVAKYEQSFGSQNPKASETKLLRYSQVSKELDQKLNQLYEEDVQTIRVINKLDNPQYKAILRDRYINHLSWHKIAQLHSYSEARLYELHRDALEAIWEFIPGKNGNV